VQRGDRRVDPAPALRALVRHAPGYATRGAGAPGRPPPAGRSAPGVLRSAPLIRLDSISKQHGHQLLFIEASATLTRGEKVGLVGPNGAGKSTLFRLITREELPDEGQVSIDRGVTISHFSQDVGEM